MSAFEWLSQMATGVGLALSGQACPLPPVDPVVIVRPLERPMQSDFTKPSAALAQVAQSQITAPVTGTQAALGGMMTVELTADTRVQFGGADARKGEGACIWASRVEVDLILQGTLYVNAMYQPGSCMHDAIAEHELEHYQQSQQVVLQELSSVQRTAMAKVDEIGVVGPMPPEAARQQGKPIGDAITAAVQAEINRLNIQQQELHAAHDNAIENLETLTACREGGGYVHQAPDLQSLIDAVGEDG
ncbi:MAG: hypothetical protein KI792_01560 [Alphaproteobacteria bacterium]|nr:hypothetical protein [Alphaproteobacteria bacterium SS10]